MATPVTLSAILKTIQDSAEDSAAEALVRNCAALSTIAVKEDWFTDELAWSVPYAGLGGRSHTASNAESNDENGRYAKFVIKQRHDYKRESMDGALVRNTLKGGVNEQFIESVQSAQDLCRGSISQNLARGFYGSHTGRRGARGSVASAVLTLGTIDDAVFFNVGDKVCAAETDGGALRDSGDFVTLIAVDTSTGQLTADANWSNIASMADGDSLYVVGDVNKSYHGLGSYVPAVAPTSGDNVFGAGVDRSQAPEQLAGVRLNITGQTVETALIRAMAQCRKKPGAAFTKSRVFVSEEDFASLRVAKEGSRFVTEAGEYNLEVESFRLGSVDVVPDVFCPTGTYFIVADGAIELRSNDGVQIDATDGNEMRKKGGDTYEMFAVFDGNFKASKPYGLARGAMPQG